MVYPQTTASEASSVKDLLIVSPDYVTLGKLCNVREIRRPQRGHQACEMCLSPSCCPPPGAAKPSSQGEGGGLPQSFPKV